MRLAAALACLAAFTFQGQPLPKWKPPYEVLPAPAFDEALARRLGGKGTAIWLDGDVLTLLHRSDAKAVAVTGGLQMPLQQVPGSNLWILQLKMKGWERAFINYMIIEDGKFPSSPSFSSWRGENAPQTPTPSPELKGRIERRTIKSEALRMDRGIVVYVPPNAPKAGLPAVFFADGVCEPIARIMEPLMLDSKVRPFAIVGVPSGGYSGDRAKPYDPNLDERAKEYVPGASEETFDRHMKFFTQEVPRFVGEEFGISTKREDRAIGGFSNGGAFVAAVAFRHPAVFGYAMPLSVGVPPDYGKPPTPLPKMYLAAGTLESFIRGTARVFEQAKEWGADAELRTFVAGHDMAMWNIAFFDFLQEIFKAEVQGGFPRS